MRMSGAPGQRKGTPTNNTKFTVDGDTEPLATVTLSLIGRSTFFVFKIRRRAGSHCAFRAGEEKEGGSLVMCVCSRRVTIFIGVRV